MESVSLIEAAPTSIPLAKGHVPLLGHAPMLSWDLPGLMRSLAATPRRLQRVRLPGQYDMLVWANPDAFKLFKAQAVSSNHMVDTAEVIAGYESMLTSDGAEHRHRRKASSHPFTPKGLTMTGVSAVISEVVELRVAAMMERSEVMMLESAQIVALDILFRVMGIPREELGVWAQNYTTLLSAVIGPKWDVPGLPYHRAMKARAWVDARLQEYVDEARRDPDVRGLIAELVRGKDDEGQTLSDTEIFDNLRLMILAGHETTASVITWMVSYAALNPAVQARLIEEALAGEGLPQSPKDLKDYPYTEAVFREALRLHPPATMTSRRLLEPMAIEGHLLPAGAIVGLPIWLFCRDPALYPEPDLFRPERWIEKGHRLSPMETSAFGGGAHFCLGYHMALVEGVQFTIALMRGLHRTERRLKMDALPGESYLPLLRPRGKDTRCRLVPAASA